MFFRTYNKKCNCERGSNCNCSDNWHIEYENNDDVKDDDTTDAIDDNYEMLSDVLNEAYEQAASGKGKERHANDEPYEEQPIMWIERYFNSYQLGQSVKKMHESQRLPKEQAVKELLGAINYIAAHIIYLNEETD